MDSDEIVPGSCIIEDVISSCEEMTVAEVAEHQISEAKSGEQGVVENAQVVETTIVVFDCAQMESVANLSTEMEKGADVEATEAMEAKIEEKTTIIMDITPCDASLIHEATLTESSLPTLPYEAAPTESSFASVPSEATPSEPSVTSVPSEVTPGEPPVEPVTSGSMPIEQPSTSGDDIDRKAIIEAILAKLNDPDAKLNRRERRALQRELEVAQGIGRAFPATSEHASTDDSSFCKISTDRGASDGDLITQKCPVRVRSSYKRPATLSHECVETAPKLKKVQDAVPGVQIIRESIFKFDNVPLLPHDSVKEAFHCARMSYVSTSFPVNNYLKLCRFSPSGSHVATTSADNSAKIFELNMEQKLSLAVKIPLGDPIYDVAWLSSESGGQLLATTAKHHPIHLWDESGTRYSSFRGINHLDELSAAYSIAFSNDGAQLYGGYDACIRIWDTSRPGRQHTSIKTWEKRTGGQKSIVSCIAMNKLFAGVYAVATYDGNVGFYSDRTNSLECMFSTESAGITDMHYSYDGQRLFVAPRKCDEILCYDMRMPGTLMFKMLRPFTTNQRACFDVDSAGRYLFSGTSDGQLVVFDLNNEATEMSPLFSRKVAECSVPCVSVHDSKIPLVALGTGERVFPTPRISGGSEASSDSSDSEEERTSYRRRRCDTELTNSLQLWTF